jgi:hypothetical protein
MSKEYKFKLNLIRNRSFLTHSISQKGTADKVVNDLFRDKSFIFINGTSLKDIFIQELKIKIENKTEEDIDQEIKSELGIEVNGLKSDRVKIDVILNIFKKYLFNDIDDEAIKQTLVEKFSKVTYQKGLFNVLGNSISSLDDVCDRGYFPNTQSIINIYKNQGEEGFYIDEECKVTMLNDQNLDAPVDKVMYIAGEKSRPFL